LNEDLEFDNDFASENKPETGTGAPTDNIPPQNYVTRSGREVKPPSHCQIPNLHSISVDRSSHEFI
jgi:hypothetical protein